jgi:hypothetical protein
VVPRCTGPVGPGCTGQSTYVRTYGIITVRAGRIKSGKAEGSNMSNESGCISESRYFMTITPTNVSGNGDPACELVVVEHVVVIREPIDAKHANDMEALIKARADVARRLRVGIEKVEY